MYKLGLFFENSDDKKEKIDKVDYILFQLSTLEMNEIFSDNYLSIFLKKLEDKNWDREKLNIWGSWGVENITVVHNEIYPVGVRLSVNGQIFVGDVCVYLSSNKYPIFTVEYYDKDNKLITVDKDIPGSDLQDLMDTRIEKYLD